MKTIGIKLADGTFYPVLEENSNQEKKLELTTANNNQTRVMVDLYRSALCSMEDAEYVDTLQIDNLIEHPYGEPDISFTVSVDEKNELSAKIVDTETGTQSKTTITLVSRTAEERLVTDDYSISDSEEESDIPATETAGIVTGGGLLAAAVAINAKDQAAEEQAEDNSLPDFDTPQENGLEDDIISPDTQTYEDLPLPDFDEQEDTDTTNLTDFDISEEPVSDEESKSFELDEISSEDTQISDDLPDFDMDNTIDETVTEPEDDLPDFDTDSTITDSDDNLPDFNTDSTITDSDNDLPDFDLDETVTETNDDLPDFDIPDDTESSDSTVVSDSLSDFDIPDNTSSSDSLDEFDLPDFNEAQNSFGTGLDESSSLESDPLESESSDLDDDDDWNFDNLDNDSSDDLPASSGISFTGLYDKETEFGESSSYEEEEVRKRTKTPVIICIICAIICILATLFILFIIPGTLKKSKKAKEPEKTVVVVENDNKNENVKSETTKKDIEEKVEKIPEAKEDEVVIIEQAEKVVPQQPPVVEEQKSKPKNTTYKIRWGDTLWDIANTYYKNPWKYKYIARYNGIKDPDYIISGTIIIIPEK